MFFILLVVGVLVAGVWLTMTHWDWLQRATDTLESDNVPESNSTTLRNIGLLIGGAIALVFALWRGLVAGHQSEAARRQAEVAQEQADLAQQGLLNERYQKGAEMLGSDVLSVRLGGIYALRNLSEENPDQYHIQIMELFCAFARHPTKDNDIAFHPEENEQLNRDMPVLRTDVQEVMQAIGSRSSTGYSLERRPLYLRDADISNLQLLSANLSCVWLTNANLSGARLQRANLSSARLRQANLSGVDLRYADLSNANLSRANLSSTLLRNVRGLTQTQLDEAVANAYNPPKLEGVLDAETGKQLVWRGRPLWEGWPMDPDS